MGRLAGNLVAIMAGALVGILLLEIGLRLAGFGSGEHLPDPAIGYRYAPHAHYRRIGEGGSVGRYNGAGWRDVEHAEAKRPGTTRILVLGDSFVAAFQVALDSTFHRRLETSLNARARPGHRFEVVALGQDGNGTATEYLTYKNWGVRYDPDVVALLFIQNDQADNWKPIAFDQARPFFVESADSLRLDTSFTETPPFRRAMSLLWFKRRCVVLAQVRRGWSIVRERRQPRAPPNGTAEDGYYRQWNFDSRLPPDSIPAFRLTRKILERFAREVAADHRRLVVFVAGFAQQEDRQMLAASRRDPHFDQDKTAHWLASIGAREHFDVVPLSPAFRAASARSGAPLWFGVPGLYGHWNCPGHAVAAEVMEKYFARTLPGLDSTGSSAR